LRDRLAEHLAARFTDEFMDAFDEAYRREVAAQSGPDPVELESAKARLKELQAEAEDVYQNVRRARDERLFAQLQEDYSAVCRKRDECQARIAEAERQFNEIDGPDVEAELVRARGAMKKLREVLAGSDPAEVRALLREHFDRIVIHFAEPDENSRSPADRAAVYVREDSPLKVFCDGAAARRFDLDFRPEACEHGPP
jgi:hypothetical protein